MKRERLAASPSQTIGPFYHFSLTAKPELGCMVQPETKGQRIRIRFRLRDGSGLPVTDSMLELWQADAAGKYDHPADTQQIPADPAFCGFGRLSTDSGGVCSFDTVYPGRVPDGRGGCQASHINISVFARGLNGRLCTRVYFEGDPALAEDPVLALVPPERRGTLLARRDPAHADLWTFDIRLQGEAETVFFDV